MLARRPHRVRLYIPQCIVDRGKYDMEMFDQFLTLRGQSYNYKIPYSTVSRLFLLPRPGQTMISFVISVNPPIRQGKTGYQHLITTFPAHDEISVNLNISDEVLASEYNGKLEKEMSGPTYEVLTKVFKVLSGKRMSIPKGFRSSRGDSCVRCAVGNQDGLLYVLDKSFMFVNKPATNLRFDDVEHVEFDRTSQEVERRALKSWDLMVVMRAGTKHTFANVERNDYDPLVAFLKGQGVKLIGAQDQTQSVSQRLQQAETLYSLVLDVILLSNAELVDAINSSGGNMNGWAVTVGDVASHHPWKPTEIFKGIVRTSTFATSSCPSDPRNKYLRAVRLAEVDRRNRNSVKTSRWSTPGEWPSDI